MIARDPRIARARRIGGGVPSPRQQRGVALLVAILLVAFGTIIAAAMAYDNAMTARRAAATFEFDQALLAAEGAEALAAYALQQTYKENLSLHRPRPALESAAASLGGEPRRDTRGVAGRPPGAVQHQ